MRPNREVRRPGRPKSTKSTEVPRTESSPRVEVRRSSRRTRTVTAYRERDTIVVVIPLRMSKADEQTFVREMVQKVLAREARALAPQGRRRARTASPSPGSDLPRAGRRPAATAGRCFLGDQSATTLGFVYAKHGSHQAVAPPAADAGVGCRLCAGARTGPPRRTDTLRSFLAAGRPLSGGREGQGLSGGIRGRQGSAGRRIRCRLSRRPGTGRQSC